MAIGKRIRFFRTLRGMTQKHLGTAVGFPTKNAEVRLAQYETGSHKPKTELAAKLANALSVSPQALTVPDIDSRIGLMHTLFALEDSHGIVIDDADGVPALKVDVSKGEAANDLVQMLSLWHKQSAKLANGEISKEEYDQWRYNYPKEITRKENIADER
jgi:transcriptional regulator with XRE-family HTH domain